MCQRSRKPDNWRAMSKEWIVETVSNTTTIHMSKLHVWLDNIIRTTNKPKGLNGHWKICDSVSGAGSLTMDKRLLCLLVWVIDGLIDWLHDWMTDWLMGWVNNDVTIKTMSWDLSPQDLKCSDCQPHQHGHEPENRKRMNRKSEYVNKYVHSKHNSVPKPIQERRIAES